MKFNYRGSEIDIVGFSEEDHIYRIISENKCFYEIDLLEYIYFITKGKRKKEKGKRKYLYRCWGKYREPLRFLWEVYS